MALIPIPSQQQVYDGFVENAQNFALTRTGSRLDPSMADGLSIIGEAFAASLIEWLGVAEQAAQDNLPGPDSPNLDRWSTLFGLMRMIGPPMETSQALWERVQLISQQASLGSLDALRVLGLFQPGVYDIAFLPQADGNFNTHVVADSVAAEESNLTGPVPGLPSAELTARLNALFNAGDKTLLGRKFNFINPTPTRYGIYTTVRYNGGDRPDTAEFQQEVEAILEAWVIRNRWLGRNVSLSTLCLTPREVEGLLYHESGLYTGNPAAGAGSQLVDLGADFTRYGVCNAAVRRVTAQSEAMANLINVRYVAT